MGSQCLGIFRNLTNSAQNYKRTLWSQDFPARFAGRYKIGKWCMSTWFKLRPKLVTSYTDGCLAYIPSQDWGFCSFACRLWCRHEWRCRKVVADVVEGEFAAEMASSVHNVLCWEILRVCYVILQDTEGSQNMLSISKCLYFVNRKQNWAETKMKMLTYNRNL